MTPQQSNWRIVPAKYLYQVCDQRVGGDSDLPLLSVSIFRGVVPRSELTDKEPRADDLDNYKICERGDIVINRMSAYQGAVGISLVAGVVSPEYLVLRAERGVDPRFLCHLIRSSWFVSEMAMRVRGIGSVEQGNVRTPRINPSDLGSIKVSLPDSRHQQVIADYLDTETARINAVIETKRRMVEVLEERQAVVLERWYRRELEQSGAVPLRRRLVAIEQGWSPTCDAAEADPEEWGVLKTSAVTSGVFRPSENKRLPAEIAPDMRWVVADGDLLVVRGSGSRNSVGQAAVVRTEGRHLMMSDLTYRLRLDDSHADYIAAALRSRTVRDQIESAIRTDAGQTLKVRVDDLKALSVPAVSGSEQENRLEQLQRDRAKVDLLITTVIVQMELLIEHRQAIITAAVSGKLDVPGVAA